MDWSGLPDQGTATPSIDFSGLPDQAPQSPANAPGTPDLASFGAQAAQYAPDGLTPENEVGLEQQFSQEHPYIYGVAQGITGMVPKSFADIQQMLTLPKPSADVERNLAESQQLGAQWRGEYGPTEQAASITGTALQALPLLGLASTESPLRATPSDAALVEQFRQAQAPIEKPPVQPEIPPSGGTIEAAPAESLKSETAAVDLSKLPDQVADSPETGTVQDLSQSPQPASKLPDAGTAAIDLEEQYARNAEWNRLNKPAPQESLQPEQPSVTIPPEDAKYAGTSPEFQARNAKAGQSDAPPVQPASVGSSGVDQAGVPERPGSGTSNRAFAETYGDESVPGGAGVDTTQLLDNARANIRSGVAAPYSILSRTRTKGIANAEEYATLAAEHERLVNDAVAKQKANAPDAPQAAKVAEDFANAIQPHKTAASDLMRLFQGDVNYDMSTPFGMDQYMKSEIGRTPTMAERPKFNRMSNDIGRAQAEVQQAVTRSDARVQRRYAKVRDIPMEEAASRVREWLKDCIV